MNKLHDILDKIKRYQFWILCGMVTVIGLVSWWLATSSLADTYTKNKSKIEAEAGKIAHVQGINPHPNEKWNISIGERVAEDRKKVADAWKTLYSEQEAKVFVWPEEILGPSFVASVKPVAASFRSTGTVATELSTDHRRLYQNNVLRQVRDLAALVDAEYADPSQASSAFGDRGYGAAARPTELLPGQTPKRVIWTGQSELQQPYMFGEETPSTLAVLYAQEEIWVIKALCNAIAQANQGSMGAHDAAVKEILAMKVGYEAAEEFPGGAKEPGRITKVTPVAPAAAGYGAGPDAGGAVGPGGPSAEGGATGGGLPRPARPDRKSSGSQGGYGVGGESGSAAPASNDPAVYLNDWRYVRGDGTPLAAADLATPPFYEYRLMPWRVTLSVDQTRWDELLVMFRNTDLPLEIRQVRVNPVADTGSGGRYSEGGSGGGGGGGYGAPSRGGGGGGYGAPAGGGRYASDGGGAAMFGFGGEMAPQETVTLQLRGIAYLLNPPNAENIGKAGSTATAAVETAVAPAMDAAAGGAPAPENPFGGPPIQAPIQSGPPPGSGGGR